MSDKNRSDFLKECMSSVGQGPIDLFQQAFCSVCYNRECSRSSSHNLSFDRRISNWKKDLFDNVPRANESDPKYASIRAKKFVTIDRSSPPVFFSSTQEPPINTDVPVHPQVIQPQIVQPQSAISEVSPELTEPTSEPTPQIPQITSQEPVVSSDQANTPFSQGTILPGFQKQAQEPSDTIIEPGETFTFGGNDG